ncbi:UNVERIFIED_CONTAM: hypothetical protein Slati_3511600 [Sesamum latifolium]|uniref:Myb/SANT-like domain-containing protein n=1 Tax=Sesamum latifolium TaxID=2727402 RepID=A0AAW2UJF1_9LAMI
MNIEFIYVLTGWEGSAVDSRVLRDAMHRPTDLRIPTGNYYLCDNGYTNGEGFLTPYRKVRYHLREWDRVAAGPQNKEELFNLKHSSARNVIECAFGLLKVRWAILRSHSFYHVKVHNRINGLLLPHNFQCLEMPDNPLEEEITKPTEPHTNPNAAFVSTIENNPVWNAWRDELAHTIMNPSDCDVQSSQRRLGAKKEKGGSQRMWTPTEEELESYMLNALPNSDIRSEPHINSKIHVWKKQYSTLTSMMTKSGFGWDENWNMITVEDNSIWEDYVKNPKSGFVSTDEGEEFPPNINIDPASASTNARKDSSASGNKQKCKRAETNAEDRLVDMVGTFCKEANTRIRLLTKVLEWEFGNEQNNDQVEDVVAEVDRLDVNKQLVIVQRLHNNPTDLHLFFKLPAHNEVGWSD